MPNFDVSRELLSVGFRKVEGLNLRAVTFLHPGVKMLSITCWTALPVLRLFSDLPRLGILLDPQGFEYFRTALPAL